MKIICQACQSKYTIADDKIQGKVAKIRCRQCGATVLIDGSVPGGGAQTDGSATTGSTPPTAGLWLVNVAEGDQRSLRTQEIVDAYNARQITAETYVWKDGFTDWLPVGQVQEIADAISTASQAGVPSAQAGAPGYHAPAGAAVRREAPHGRAGDLFKGGAKDDEVATGVSPRPAAASGGTPAPAPAGASGKATGSREESSNIFSLGALTGSAGEAPAPFVPQSSSARGREDSGVIDLNALAKAQAAKTAQPAAAPAPAAPQFLFPAALGQVQAPAPMFDIPEPPSRSSLPKIVAIGVVIAIGAVGVALFATHKEEPAPAPPVATTAPPAPEPTPAPTASPTPPPSDSAAPVATSKATKKSGGTGRAGGTKKTSNTDTTVALPPPGPKRGACGCAPGDMACNIRCSATGK
jgi:predicted Zn finger-like uncharacterized protein